MRSRSPTASESPNRRPATPAVSTHSPRCCRGITTLTTAYPPRVNAARAPGEWQTLDVIFRVPRFETDGKKTKTHGSRRSS